MGGLARGATHLPGVLQGLIAAALGGACQPILGVLWRLLAQREPPYWAEATFPHAMAAAVILGILAFSTTAVGNGVRRRHRTAAPEGSRIAIFVAQLDGDDNRGSLRRAIIDTIVHEAGRDALEVIPAGLTILRRDDLSDDDAAKAANEESRSFLRANNGDLLIWGEVLREGANLQIALRFVSETISTEGTRFGLDNQLFLDRAFLPQLGSILAALSLVLARPSAESIGSDALSSLLRVAPKLERLSRHPPGDATSRRQVAVAYALAATTIAFQTGDREILTRGVTGLVTVRHEVQKEAEPLEWATVTNNLATSLTTRASYGSDSQSLKEAIDLFKQALQVRTRTSTPYDWAATQNNLGNALRQLGEMEQGTEAFRQAVSAYQAATWVWTPDSYAQEWASARHNLGVVLRSLGERETGTEHLEEAVQACRDALKMRVAGLDWALAKTGLGNALATLATRQQDPKGMKAAVAAYGDALEWLSVDRTPLHWANAKTGLGQVLATLGAISGDVGLLRQGVEACGEAIQGRPRNRVPLEWAEAMSAWGDALQRLGDQTGEASILDEAVVAYRDALEEKDRNGAPLRWAATQHNLAVALHHMGLLRRDASIIDEAVSAFDGPIEEFQAAGLTWFLHETEHHRDQAAADRKRLVS